MLKRTSLLLVSLLLVATAFAQEASVREKHYNLKNDLAIQGYDPVSYFAGKPKEGKSSITLKHKGTLYRLYSEANKKKFRAEPARYEPAFGGWCAYAMGNTAEKVKIDPETYKFVNGRLYLYYNFWGNNTLDDWNDDPVNLDAKAMKNWKNWLVK